MIDRDAAFEEWISEGVNLSQMPPEMARQVGVQWLSLARRHGLPPTGRRLVAGHEAGHAIVQASAGRGVESVYIKCHAGEWGGMCTPGDAQRYDVRSEPGGYAATMADAVAGVTAEELDGHGHPAACFDERSMFRAQAFTFAQVYGLNGQLVQMQVLLAVLQVLWHERERRERIAERLHKRKSLERAYLAELTRDTVQVDWGGVARGDVRLSLPISPTEVLRNITAGLAR